jgi:hypothetical protein
MKTRKMSDLLDPDLDQRLEEPLILRQEFIRDPARTESESQELEVRPELEAFREFQS